MTKYNVTWTVQVEAHDATQAAHVALEQVRDTSSKAVAGVTVEAVAELLTEADVDQSEFKITRPNPVYVDMQGKWFFYDTDTCTHPQGPYDSCAVAQSEYDAHMKMNVGLIQPKGN